MDSRWQFATVFHGKRIDVPQPDEGGTRPTTPGGTAAGLDVAIKVIDKARCPCAAEMEAEVSIMKMLRHPNILQVPSMTFHDLR